MTQQLAVSELSSPVKETSITANAVVELANCSISDVAVILEAIQMSDLAAIFAENRVTGAMLLSCDDLDDVKELGVTKKIVAKTLLRHINEWSSKGLSAEIMTRIVTNREGFQSSTVAVDVNVVQQDDSSNPKLVEYIQANHQSIIP